MTFSGMHFDPVLLVITVVVMLVSFLVSSRLKSKFKQYSQTPLASGLSGKEIAEMMLRDNGIYDVKVLSVEGQLTDHYNPADKTVNLSDAVYNGRNAASAAVAAHECGHAVQHATAYSMLQFRSAMVPIQNVSAQVMNFMMIAFMFGGFFFMRQNMGMLLGIYLACYGVFALFSLVTLPVEFDASKRAKNLLHAQGFVNQTELKGVDKVLDAAAWTYVAAAIQAVLTVMYFVYRMTGNSRD